MRPPKNLKEGKRRTMTTIVETVTYKLAGGIDRNDFLKANEAMTSWLSRQSGFQYRSLSEKDDGSWLDIVYWNSKAEVEAAEVSFQKEMMATDFYMMVDPNSLEMERSAVATYYMAAEAA